MGVCMLRCVQVQNGDVIRIDAKNRSMDVLGVDDGEWGQGGERSGWRRR